MIDLKTCPFCGNEVIFYQQNHTMENFHDKNTIYCKQCQFEMTETNKYQLIKKWNSRNSGADRDRGYTNANSETDKEAEKEEKKEKSRKNK